MDGKLYLNRGHRGSDTSKRRKTELPSLQTLVPLCTGVKSEPYSSREDGVSAIELYTGGSCELYSIIDARLLGSFFILNGALERLSLLKVTGLFDWMPPPTEAAIQ